MPSSSTSTLPFMPADDEHLDVSALETWLWDAACAIRGATDAPKFKDFILPLVFYKRLSDVFDDEFARYAREYGDAETAHAVIEADHEDALKTGRKSIVRFYVPAAYTWRVLRNHPADGSLGEFVTTAMREVARLNPDLQGVLDVKDYNERQSGQRTLDDERLAALIEVITRHRLGLPAPRSTVHDPTCGSGGLLIKARLLYERRHPELRTQTPKLYGQELNATTFAMAKMNIFLHDYTDAYFAIGDTLRRPGFASAGAGVQRFDYVVANPMWNQDGYDESFYAHDEYGRFSVGGIPPKSSADWGWVQHMLAALNEHGRAAIVLDTGAVSRGSGSKQSNKERDIRRALVEADVVEGVVLLPENLFYNTSAPGILLLLNRSKPADRQGLFLLINASMYFAKEKPKNVLTDAGIAAVAVAYRAWETRAKLSRVVTLEEVRTADYNLSPSQFVEVGDRVQHRPLADILADLAAARMERERADAELATVLARLELFPS